MRCPSKIDKAYLAGILDSDGSICLAYQTKDKRTLRPTIGIFNRDIGLLEWIRKTFTTGWNSALPKQPRHRKVFQYSVGSRKNVAYILRMVLSFLKVKKRQAELVLEFCENHQYGVYTERDWEIFTELKILNKRGD